MNNNIRLIGIRHLEARDRRIPVLFFRNTGGSVSGKLLLGANDSPILDGPTPDAVLALAEDVLDWVFLARSLQTST